MDMTDTSKAAALRALVGGKATPPDMRTLKAVHRGLVLLPDEAPATYEHPAEDPTRLTTRRAVG